MIECRGGNRVAVADPEYESASEQEEAPSTAVRSETSLLADELLGLCLQTPLKGGAPRPAPPTGRPEPPPELPLSDGQKEAAIEDLPPPPAELLLPQAEQQSVQAEGGAAGAETGAAESESDVPAPLSLREQPEAVLGAAGPPPGEESVPVAEETHQTQEQSVPGPEETVAVPEQSLPVSEEPASAPEELSPAPEPVAAPEEPPAAAEESVPVDGTEPPLAESVCDGEAATSEVRAASPPIRAVSPPIRAASPPIRAISPPIRATSPSIRAASPPIRSASPPVRSSSPPIRSSSPPIRGSSPPIRAGSPPIRSGSPPIRSTSPPIRSGSPPIHPPSTMTQTGDEDEPIPPKVGYNLDFLDDPNFNPFATGTGVKLSPPGSPKAALPPLKAAKTKKQREAAAAADSVAPGETNGVNGEEASTAEQPQQPAKPPARKPVKKPVRPVRRPVKKPTPPPAPEPEPEPEPEPAAENGRPDSPPLPPAKGYNLDFLDNCDDPNFNPFATKSAVNNSPTGSPKAGRKVANSPPLPARKSPAKQVIKAKPEPEPTKPEPGPEPVAEPEPVAKPEPKPEPVAKPEPEPVVKSEPEPESQSGLEESGRSRPDPLGGGDASASARSDASRSASALLDTAPLDFSEVTAASAPDPEMVSLAGDQFVEATNFVFHDPAALDRLAEHGDGRLAPAIARNSLYVKFDPLLGRPSVLPEIQRLAGRADESTPAVPRQLTSVKSDLIAFSPGKEPVEPPPPTAPAAAPAPATSTGPATPPVTGDDNFALLKKQELYFQDQLLKRDREMTAMKNANSKLIQQASNNKSEKVLERAAPLVAHLSKETIGLRRELQTALRRMAAERDEARQEVANAEAMFADLHRKYEKSKSVLQEYRRCAERSDAACMEARETAGRERQRFDMLRQHSEDAHGRLQTELKAADEAHQTELLTLKAKLQLAENRADKLERENREVTAICDELIQKMGGAR